MCSSDFFEKIETALDTRSFRQFSRQALKPLISHLLNDCEKELKLFNIAFHF